MGNLEGMHVLVGVCTFSKAIWVDEIEKEKKREKRGKKRKKRRKKEKKEKEKGTNPLPK